MLDNIASKLFLIPAFSSGKFQNVKWFLAKMWKYISGVPKVSEEEKKVKTYNTTFTYTTTNIFFSFYSSLVYLQYL